MGGEIFVESLLLPKHSLRGCLDNDERLTKTSEI